MTTTEMLQLATERGYDIEITGKGKRALYCATHRATGRRLVPCSTLPAAMRIVDAHRFGLYPSVANG